MTQVPDIRPRPVPDGPDWPDFHPVLTRIYRARGIGDPDELDHRLSRLLPPQGLAGLARGVSLLADALTRGRRIVICGDYDADGATALAMMVRGLSAMGAGDVRWRVPNRFRHGYGLSPGFVDELAELAPAVLVTVDHGTASIEGVRAARARGFAVVITDHHLPGPELPEADALINPNLVDDGSPGRHLAGCGVALYVLTALRAELRNRGWFRSRSEPNLAELTDLVALGTVADLVPLDQNNRVLVQQGLDRIRAGRACPGIRALLGASLSAPERVDAGTLGFLVAPRLNAAGRLDDMAVGVRCLLADDPAEAAALAEQLSRLNRERREIQDEMQVQALAALTGVALDGRRGLVVHDPGWHHGVVGLIASKLVERCHRPTLALAPDDDGNWRGSGRSIKGVHLRDALALVDARHPGLLTRFGGHAMAAGFSAPADVDLARLGEAFETALASLDIDACLQPVIDTDGSLAAWPLDLDLARALAAAGPFGQGFPPPLFDDFFTVLDCRWIQDRHLKLRLHNAHGGPPLEAMRFHATPEEHPVEAGQRWRLLYQLEVSVYQGEYSALLNVRRLLPA